MVTFSEFISASESHQIRSAPNDGNDVLSVQLTDQWYKQAGAKISEVSVMEMRNGIYYLATPLRYTAPNTKFSSARSIFSSMIQRLKSALRNFVH